MSTTATPQTKGPKELMVILVANQLEAERLSKLCQTHECLTVRAVNVWNLHGGCWRGTQPQSVLVTDLARVALHRMTPMQRDYIDMVFDYWRGKNAAVVNLG